MSEGDGGDFSGDSSTDSGYADQPEASADSGQTGVDDQAQAAGQDGSPPPSTAEAALEQCITLFPNYSAAIGVAAPFLEREGVSDLTHARLAYGLAVCYESTGDWGRAWDAMQRLIEWARTNEPHNVDTWTRQQSSYEQGQNWGGGWLDPGS